MADKMDRAGHQVPASVIEREIYARRPCIVLQREIAGRVPWCADYTEPLPYLRLSSITPSVQLGANVVYILSLCPMHLLLQVLHLAASLSPNQDIAFMAAIGWTCLNLLMSGYFITFKDMAFSWMSHLRYTSAMHFAFEGQAAVEFSNRQFDCSAGLGPGAEKLLPLLVPSSLLGGSSSSASNSSSGSSSVFGGSSSTVAGGAQQQQQQVMVVVSQLMGQLSALQQQQQEQEQEGGCVVRSDALLEYFGFQRPFAVSVPLLLAYWLVLHVATVGALMRLARQERR